MRVVDEGLWGYVSWWVENGLAEWVDKYHEKSPDGVVGEDGAGEDEHCEAYEAVELVGVGLLAFVVFWGLLEGFVQGCWRPFLDCYFGCSVSLINCFGLYKGVWIVVVRCSVSLSPVLRDRSPAWPAVKASQPRQAEAAPSSM